MAKAKQAKKRDDAAKMVTITLVKSPIGFDRTQGATVQGMGLRRIGHSVELVIPDSLQAAHHAWYATAERRPGCSRANEATVPARCRDGQTIQIRGNITVLQDRSGRVTGAALIVRLADELP